MKITELKQRILELKEARKAVILAHLYQPDEIQEIADYTGDSLELSKIAAETDAATIVFCGVKFMAETAKILSPEKMVLLPVVDAGCPLADMIGKEDVLELKEKYPQAVVVCYVNSTAEVKSVSDYCCTSSNAVSLVKNIPEKEIIFIPDKNLGAFVAKNVPEKKLIIWNGYCTTHNNIVVENLEKIKKVQPTAEIMVHPECRSEVAEKADYIGSTGYILKAARKSEAENIIIGTEIGILYRLKKENPDKNFIELSDEMICPDMKKTRLEDVYFVLNEMKNQVYVEKSIRENALIALKRMLEYC